MSVRTVVWLLGRALQWSKLNGNRCPENSNMYRQHDLVVLHLSKYLACLLTTDFYIYVLDCNEKPR
jgi:hypothetical protein